MRKIIIAISATVALMSLGYAGQSASFNADINANTNSNASDKTSMNGNTATANGVPISSTAASKESRSVTGNGD